MAIRFTIPFLLIFGFLMLADNSLAQNPLVDENATFFTDDGYQLEKEKAEALLESELFYIIRKRDSVGNNRYIFRRYKKKDKSVADTLFIETNSGKPMPAFDLTSVDKKRRKLNAYLGKPTIYNFWFTTCKPCLEEIPLLNKVVEKYKDSINFVAFTFENFDKVNSFLKKTKFDYEIIPNAQDLCNELKISSYPIHIITDHKGIIEKVYVGGSNIIDIEIELAIGSMLKEHQY